MGEETSENFRREIGKKSEKNNLNDVKRKNSTVIENFKEKEETPIKMNLRNRKISNLSENIEKNNVDEKLLGRKSGRKSEKKIENNENKENRQKENLIFDKFSLNKSSEIITNEFNEYRNNENHLNLQEKNDEKEINNSALEENEENNDNDEEDISIPDII